MDAHPRPSVVAHRLVHALGAGIEVIRWARPERLHAPAPDPTPLTPDAVSRYITKSLAGTLTLELAGITYFALEPERRWPAFAAIETGEGLDGSMRGLPDGSFRVSVMVGHRTFERLSDRAVGVGRTTPDVLLPHPTYDGLCWVSILNPSVARFNEILAPRLAEAYGAMRTRLGLGPVRVPRAGQPEAEGLGYLDV